MNQEPRKIKSWWISIKWDDGEIIEIDPPNDSIVDEMEQYLNEIEYLENKELMDKRSQEAGDNDY
jgi:hypothetical protein